MASPDPGFPEQPPGSSTDAAEAGTAWPGLTQGETPHSPLEAIDDLLQTQSVLQDAHTDSSTSPPPPQQTGTSESELLAPTLENESGLSGSALDEPAETQANQPDDSTEPPPATSSNHSSAGATDDNAAASDSAPIHNVGANAHDLSEPGSQAGAATTVPGEAAETPSQPAVTWADVAEEPVEVKYDFRDQNGYANLITPEERATTVAALDAWSQASGGNLVFVQDTEAPASEIVNFGVGDLAAFGNVSAPGGTLALGGGLARGLDSGQPAVSGVAWLDASEEWDATIGNGDPAGTHDFFTTVSHEIGHVLGFADDYAAGPDGILNPVYTHERLPEAITVGLFEAGIYESQTEQDLATGTFDVHPMMTGFPQLVGAEVEQLLDRAAAATASEDAIIAVVDRGGHILGVRVEQDVLDAYDANNNNMIDAGPELELLVFAIDGAVAKARTAAFFSNGDPTNIDAFSPDGTLAPLTSRLVRFVSQSTVTQREVESNPNITDPNSTVRGPGFVAPIGLGGHFPPDVRHTPVVDLFAIEHTNRDSIIHPGNDGIKGTADDVTLRARFNIDPTFVTAGQEIDPPESYGFTSTLLPNAQSRGIATLPGGIPLFRDTNGDGVGETLVGGIGVFFPGPDGYATFEQGFVPGIGQTTNERVNAPKVLEAEYIGLIATGGSFLAGLPVGDFLDANGMNVPAVPGLDLPFGRLDLVGITLQVIGPKAGIVGAETVVEFGRNLGVGSKDSGANQQIAGGGQTVADGQSVPDGWLVEPHDSPPGGSNLTADDVRQIIEQGIAEAQRVRAAVRLTGSGDPSSRTRMVFAVTDTSGEVLGLFRMQDATVFSIDVAVAKARNTAYYADPVDLQPQDQVPGIPAGVAFSNRTFRFLAEPRFPSGVDFSQPPEFSILNDPGINPLTAENLGAPQPASAYTSVLGFDAFNPQTNFRDPGDANVVAAPLPPNDPRKANQNGVVFFPGSTPLYKNGVLVGGFGVSGDGVDQDDVVTFFGAQGFLPTAPTLRADQVKVDEVRLPFIKFLRNPRG